MQWWGDMVGEWGAEKKGVRGARPARRGSCLQSLSCTVARQHLFSPRPCFKLGQGRVSHGVPF